MRTNLRIAIADDDPELRSVLTQLIERLGHHVECVAADGDEMLKMSAECEMDLALIDLDMPMCDGLEVAEELSRTKGIPVIIMSGHADFRHVVRENEPVLGYLSKPFTVETLLAAIVLAIGAR